MFSPWRSARLQNWACFTEGMGYKIFLGDGIWFVLANTSIHGKRTKEVESGESQKLASTECLASEQTPASVRVRDPVWKIRWESDPGLENPACA